LNARPKREVKRGEKIKEKKEMEGAKSEWIRSLTRASGSKKKMRKADQSLRAESPGAPSFLKRISGTISGRDLLAILKKCTGNKSAGAARKAKT